MSHDTLVHRLVRPAVRRLARTAVTPNQLTSARLVTGLIAAIGFAKGGTLWPNLGGAVMLLSLLLDRADGELARQTGQMSGAGYRYDLFSDCVATMAAFVGMGLGSQAAFGRVSVLLGLVAGASVVAVFWLINGVKLVKVASYTTSGGRVLIDPDDALLTAPVFVWCGAMAGALAIAAAVTPLVAVGLVVGSYLNARRTRRGRSASVS